MSWYGSLTSLLNWSDFQAFVKRTRYITNRPLTSATCRNNFCFKSLLLLNIWITCITYQPWSWNHEGFFFLSVFFPFQNDIRDFPKLIFAQIISLHPQFTFVDFNRLNQGCQYTCLSRFRLSMRPTQSARAAFSALPVASWSSPSWPCALSASSPSFPISSANSGGRGSSPRSGGLDLSPYNLRKTWAATWQNQQNGRVPSEDSDQPGHPPSLFRVFAVRMKKPWALTYPLSAQQRLWSDWVDAQTDLSLCWANTHFVGFVMSRLSSAITVMVLGFRTERSGQTV